MTDKQKAKLLDKHYYTNCFSYAQNVVDMNYNHLLNASRKMKKENIEDCTPERAEFIKHNIAQLGEELDRRDNMKQHITIPMTEQDCEEVMQGEEFHWTFPDQNGKDISVTIRAERDEDNE